MGFYEIFVRGNAEGAFQGAYTIEWVDGLDSEGNPIKRPGQLIEASMQDVLDALATM